MQAESPVRIFGRQTNKLSVLASNRGGVGLASGEEVEVKDTTDDVVLKSRLLAVGLVELDVHAVGVEQQDTVRAGLAVLLVDGVGSVEVGGVGNAVSIAVELQ